MTRTARRVGIVLFQLGGPDTLEAIEPFLYNLFCDPDIIDFPFARIGRKPLAKLISATRDRTGAVIDGNAEKVTDVTDVWTFARDISSRDPNWKVIATEAGQ